VPGPPPHSHVAHAGSRSEVIARCSSASWPGTHTLQLLTVYCSSMYIRVLMLVLVSLIPMLS
jgi:cytochrome c biogenesis protein ResB